MNKNILLIGTSFFLNQLFAQTAPADIRLESKAASESIEMRDFMDFEGINYYHLKFTGSELKDKAYEIRVKEIWNGELVKDTLVIDSEDIGLEYLEKVNDTSLLLRVIAKHTAENKLRINFMFPRFSVNKEYKALPRKDYRLRNMADESKTALYYGQKFYLLAYILPYERPDGSSSWCQVASNGKDIENWGKRFGIKHYLLFEMLFK